jgi:hypothetical protein
VRRVYRTAVWGLHGIIYLHAMQRRQLAGTPNVVDDDAPKQGGREGTEISGNAEEGDHCVCAQRETPEQN